MNRTLILAILSIVALSGCAGPRKQLSREEWLNTTTRTYSGVTQEQAISAAERLLLLADGDDFAIVHNPQGFDANRNWMAYLVFAAARGTDHWKFSVRPMGNGITATISVTVQSQAAAPTKIGDDIAAPFGQVNGYPIDGPALYELFWSRMDYLLGSRQSWMTCKEANDRVKQGVTWGNQEPLCNSFNMKDAAP